MSNAKIWSRGKALAAPSSFPKEMGGEKACFVRYGSRSVVWYVFPETGKFLVIRRDNDDEEVIRVVGNVSAPTSSRVMLRMCIGYSAFVRQQVEKELSIASAEGLTDPPTNNSRAVMQRAIDRATVTGVDAVSAIEAEYNALAATLSSDVSAKPVITQPRVVVVVLGASQRARARAYAQVMHRTALRTAAARRELAHNMRSVRSPQKATKHQGGQAASTRSTRNNAVSAVVLLLFIASLWGPAAWSASREVGMSGARRAESKFNYPGGMNVNESVISGEYLTIDMEAPNLSQRVPRVMERQYRETERPGSCLYVKSTVYGET